MLPLAFGLIYQLVIAAPRYVSESEFMVRTLASSDMGNLATLLTDQKVTRASDETYAVSEYLTSRDAVDALAAQDGLKAILSRPDGDFINRFPNIFTRDTREQLFRHFQNFADLSVSSDSGIAQPAHDRVHAGGRGHAQQGDAQERRDLRQPPQHPRLRRFAGDRPREVEAQKAKFFADRELASPPIATAPTCSTPTGRSPTC